MTVESLARELGVDVAQIRIVRQDLEQIYYEVREYETTCSLELCEVSHTDKCVMQQGRPTCRCSDGYGGAKCESRTRHASGSPEPYTERSQCMTCDAERTSCCSQGCAPGSVRTEGGALPPRRAVTVPLGGRANSAAPSSHSRLRSSRKHCRTV